MRVGYVLPMGEDRDDGVAASGREIVVAARELEDAGFDSLWVFDHLLMQSPGEAPEATWEAWSLLAALAATTERATLGTIVTCTGFRPPGLLAKMAHTVHEMSGGRLLLGLGAGWHEPEYAAFGYPFDRRFSRFEEAFAIITAMLREGRSTFSGTFHSTVDAPLLPTPTLPPPPIMIGTHGAKMLALTARHADAYNTAWHGRPGDRFAGVRQKLHEALAQADRDPATLRLTVGMMLRADDAKPDAPGVPCEPDAIADALRAWESEGVDEVVVWAYKCSNDRARRTAEGLASYRA